jgi:hypothetical protein
MIFMTRFYHSSVSLCNRVSSVRSIPVKIVFILLAFTVFFASCEEEPTLIGKNILPGTDFVLIESIDTMKMVSYTMYDDSTRSDNPSLSYIGRIWDPYFGTTTASFVTQLRLKQEWDGKPYVLDSMKLVMEFSTVNGDVSGIHYLNMFEINDELNTETAYYTNTPVAYAGFSLSDTLPALKADTINNIVMNFYPDDNGIIPLAERLFQDTSKLFHSNNQPDFRSYFKGLHFTITSEGDPIMATLGLANSNDGYLIIDRYYKNFFVLYYHDPNSTANPKPAQIFYFMLDAVNRNASYNIISHDFSTALEENRIENVNNFYIDTLSYLQNLNGVYTRIVFPGLPALKADPAFANIAVNKARLTVPYFDNEDLFKDATTPRQLYLRYRTTEDSKPLVQDYSIDQYHSFYDGLVDTTKHIYNFNLATFVQAYLEDTSGKILPELEIFQASSNRNMIFRANNSASPLKFELTYTRF